MDPMYTFLATALAVTENNIAMAIMMTNLVTETVDMAADMILTKVTAASLVPAEPKLEAMEAHME